MTDELHRVEFTVEGMNCTNCALGLERHLKKVGVPEASVNFATSTVRVGLKQPKDMDFVVAEVSRLGYQATDVEGQAAERRPFLTLERKVALAVLFTLPFIAHMFAEVHALHLPLVQLLLALPVYLIGTLHFGRSALGSLRAGLPNMDALIVIGVNAAFLYSLIGTLFGLGPDYLFYETAASITTFVLVGNLMEERAVRKTTSAVGELGALQAREAKRISETGGEESIEVVDALAVAVGDRILVNTGDRVPADGVVYRGAGSVDESMLSGESLPVEKAEGSAVVGGTVVTSGALRFTATAVGEQTTLAGIIRLVQETRENRPRIQRLGDIVSGYFVPAVVGISVLTLVGSLAFGVSLHQSLLRAIAVLVISCPCAMGLATPTAVMVGIGRAARRGILMKGGTTIESLAKTGTVVFDKTGTLTTGRFSITRLKTTGRDEAFVRSVLLGLETHSSHPLAKSIVEECRASSPHPFTDIRETRGVGIEGTDPGGVTYSLGSRTIVGDRPVEEGFSLYLLENGAPIAYLAVEDSPKPEAEEVIRLLHGMGIRTVLSSGDRRAACEKLAKELGIDETYAEQLPEQKLELIERLKRSGRSLAYVGDGINDAPALTAAAVGISFSTATEAAIQSSQVVLLNGDLKLVVTALSLARVSYRTIKQNLFWAFFYNIAAIPAAALGFLTPTIAALTMAFSDVIVIGNSILLKRKRVETDLV